MKILARANKKLRGNGKFYTIPEPTKSWFYVTEYDSNGYPIKAKTIGCSGDMPYSYMYVSSLSSNTNKLTYYCEDFEINEGVTNVVENAFNGCSNLKTVIIPSSVTSIGKSAFAYCTNLTSIEIPNSVTSIGPETFNRCSNLKNIKLPNSIAIIQSDIFFYCTSLQSIIIPNSVITIKNGAFFNCNKLTSIKFSNSLTSIEKGAFQYCSSCLLFDFREATQIPTLSNTDAFGDTSSSKKIVVPDSLYDSWKSATNWSSYASYIVKASEYVEA